MTSSQKNVHLIRVEGKVEAEMIESLLRSHSIYSMRKARYHPGPSIGLVSAYATPFGIDIYVSEKNKEKALEVIQKNKNVPKKNQAEEEGEKEYQKRKSRVRLAFGIIGVIFIVIPVLLALFSNAYLFLREFFT